MKQHLLVIFIGLVISLVSIGQNNQGFKYQAVLKGDDGKVIANETVVLKMAVIKSSESGTVIYEEEHSEITNSFGLINLKIGKDSLL